MMTADEVDLLTRKPREARAHPETAAPPRWLLMTCRLYEGGAITLRWLMDQFGVSLATAKRDMALIEAYLPTVRDARDHPSKPVAIRLLTGARLQGHINAEHNVMRVSTADPPSARTPLRKRKGVLK